jgi:NAD(P)-dependent dehydrogenase (short-subunit alcohol dehydrogenase family)
MQLKGKNAIVTGSAHGIGRAIALGYAAEGAKLVLGDIDMPALNKTVADIQAAGGEAVAVEVDVSRSDQVVNLMATALATYPRIHILVCVPGISTIRHFLDLPEEEWDQVMSVNLKSQFLCGQAAARHMAKAGGGVIINVTSQVAEVAQPMSVHYHASKGGGKMLVKAMALDLAEHNIRVNALGPGLTDTHSDWLNTEDGQRWVPFRKKLPERIPMKRAARPEEMVGPAVFLASDSASYVTGISLYVDGGYLAI